MSICVFEWVNTKGNALKASNTQFLWHFSGSVAAKSEKTSIEMLQFCKDDNGYLSRRLWPDLAVVAHCSSFNSNFFSEISSHSVYGKGTDFGSLFSGLGMMMWWRSYFCQGGYVFTCVPLVGLLVCDYDYTNITLQIYVKMLRTWRDVVLSSPSSFLFQLDNSHVHNARRNWLVETLTEWILPRVLQNNRGFITSCSTTTCGCSICVLMNIYVLALGIPSSFLHLSFLPNIMTVVCLLSFFLLRISESVCVPHIHVCSLFASSTYEETLDIYLIMSMDAAFSAWNEVFVRLLFKSFHLWLRLLLNSFKDISKHR